MNERSRWENFRERLSNLEPSQLLIPFILLIVIIGTIIGIVNYSRRRAMEQPPKVEITSPSGGATTEDDKVTVSGVTNPGSAVSVNEQSVTVDENGNFSKEIALNAGENKVRIVATNEIGKSTESEVAITRLEKAQAPVAGVDTTNVTGSDLSRSGPETLWIPEISALSLAVASWFGSKKRLNKTVQKRAI